MSAGSSSRSGYSLRARAREAASSLLQKASDGLSERQQYGLAQRLDGARQRLDRNPEVDILGRSLRDLEKERKLASVYSEDHVVAFPGYAALHSNEVVVQVSGFAYRTRPLDRASRSQKLFVAAARQLAGLARLPDKPPANGDDVTNPSSVLSDEKQSAYEKLLALGEEAKLIDDVELEAEVDTLAEEPNGIKNLSLTQEAPAVPAKPASLRSVAPQRQPSRQSTASSSSKFDEIDASSELGRMHINLRDRLRAFFAQKLEGRHIRVEIKLVNDDAVLARGSLLTQEGGGFSQLVTFPSSAVKEGEELLVSVELLANPDVDAPMVEGEHQRSDIFQVQIAPPKAVHVISDLDDTCKHSQVLAGARVLIRNVFARELADLSVPGMQSWYDAMSRKGCSFHYVSNSPWELAPVVKAFLSQIDMPRGQIVLKQYSGSSGLIGNLWEPAGQRKRGNLESVLQAFKKSPFILIGDSGEQDLEIYVSLAREYPHQIKAIFIRDVTTAFARSSTDKSKKTPKRSQSTDPSVIAKDGLEQLSSGLLVEPNSDALSPNNPARPDQASSSSKLLEAFYQRLNAAERALPDGVILKIFAQGEDVQEEALQLIDTL